MSIIRVIILIFLATGVFYIIVLNVFIRKSNHVQILNVDDFEKQLATTKEAQLIDVRTSREFKKYRIESAKNIDYLSITFRRDLKKLDKTKPVLVYCHSGYRSKMVLPILSRKGFTSIYELNTGFSGWLKAQKAIEQCYK